MLRLRLCRSPGENSLSNRLIIGGIFSFTDVFYIINLIDKGKFLLYILNQYTFYLLIMGRVFLDGETGELNVWGEYPQSGGLGILGPSSIANLVSAKKKDNQRKYSLVFLLLDIRL